MTRHTSKLSQFFGVIGVIMGLSMVARAQRQQVPEWISPPSSTLLLNQPYPLELDSKSPVAFDVVSGPAFIEGSVLTVTNLGMVEVVGRTVGEPANDSTTATKVFNRGEMDLVKVGAYEQEAKIVELEVSSGVVFLMLDRGFSRGRLQIVDARKPHRPELVFTRDFRRAFRRIEVVGNYAYVIGDAEELSSRSSTLHVFDVSNLHEVNQVSETEIVGTGFSGVFAVRDSRAQISFGSELVTMDVGDPLNPRLVSRYSARERILGWHLVDGFTFLRTAHETQVLDFREPQNPVSVHIFAPMNAVRHQLYSGYVSYGLDQIGNLVSVDHRDVENPQVLATQSLAGWLHGLRISDDLLYASDHLGLSIIDVSEPANPIRLAYSDQHRGAFHIQAEGDLVYLAQAKGGVQIFQRTPAINQRLPQPLQWRVPSRVPIHLTPFPLDAESRSGLPIHYDVVSGPARIEGDQLALTGFGSVVVQGDQSGNDQFQAAREEWEFEVAGGKPQTIDWASPEPGSTLLLHQAYPLEVAVTSEQPITFKVASGPALIEGGLVTVTNLGAVVLEAHQAGNRVYQAVSSTQVFNNRGSLQSVLLGRHVDDESVYDVEIRNDLAFLAKGEGGFEILDVSDPRKPASLTQYQSGGRVLDVAVNEGLVFLANNVNGLEVLNIKDPGLPRVIGHLDVPCYHVEASGNVAVVAVNGSPRANNNGFLILDVSDPSNPEPISEGLRLYEIRNLSIDRDDLYVVGDYGNAGVQGGFMERFDISVPSRPTVNWDPHTYVGGDPYPSHCFDSGRDVWDVRVLDDRLYVGDNSDGLQIYDIASEPPRLLNHPAGSFDTRTFEANGHFAYQVVNRSGVGIIDITSPSRPKAVGLILPTVDDAFPKGPIECVRAVDQFVYLGFLKAGLHIYRLQPEKLVPSLSWQVPPSVGRSEFPLTLSAESSSGLSLSYEVLSGPARVENNQLVATGVGAVEIEIQQTEENGQFEAEAWVRTVSVAEKREQSLTWISPEANAVIPRGRTVPIQLETDSGLSVTIEVEGGPGVIDSDGFTVTGPGPVALVARLEGDAEHNSASSKIIINPAKPTGIEYVGRINLPHFESFEIVGDLAYVKNESFSVYDIQDPENPRRLSHYVHPALGKDVQVVDGFAYGALGESFVLLDVRDPGRMTLAGEYRSESYSFSGVQVVDGIAYLLANHLPGLEVVDVSVPNKPTRLGGYVLEDFPSSELPLLSLQVANGKAYLRSSRGVEIIEVTDPENPVIIGHLDGDSDLEVVGDSAYRLRDPVEDFIENSGSKTFERIDTSDPENLRRTGVYSILNCVRGTTMDVVDNIRVKASEAFVIEAGGRRGTSVNVIDISQASIPRGGSSVLSLSQVSVPGFSKREISDFEVEADKLYLAQSREPGVWVFQLEYPRTAQNVPLVVPESLDLSRSALPLPSASNYGLRVEYSVVSGPARVEGNRLIVTGVGAVVVAAEQAGNEQFLPLSEHWLLSVPIPRPGLSIHRDAENQIHLQVPTISGLTYTIQGRGSLTGGEWETLAASVGTGEPWTLSSDSAIFAEQFYRVLVRDEGAE